MWVLDQQRPLDQVPVLIVSKDGFRTFWGARVGFRDVGVGGDVHL